MIDIAGVKSFKFHMQRTASVSYLWPCVISAFCSGWTKRGCLGPFFSATASIWDKICYKHTSRI